MPQFLFKHCSMSDACTYLLNSSDSIFLFVFGVYYSFIAPQSPSCPSPKHFLQYHTPHLKHISGSFLLTSLILWNVMIEEQPVVSIIFFPCFISSISFNVYRLCCSLEIYSVLGISDFQSGVHNPSHANTRL